MKDGRPVVAVFLGLLSILSVPGLAADAQPIPNVRGRDSDDFSETAQSLLKKGTWWTIDTEHFTCWSARSNRIVRYADLAEYAYDKAGSYVGAEPASFQGRLALVEDESIWRRLPEVADRPDAVSFQSGKEIFILTSANDAETVLRVAHEVVHLRLDQICPEGLPLWMEEGLAAYVGWRTAEGYGRSQRKVFKQTLPKADGNKLFEIDRLSALQDYPSDVSAARAFYRQSAALTRAIAYRIGDDRLPEWGAAMCGKKAVWREVLTATFGFSEQDFYALEQEMKKNAMRTGWD